MRAPSRRQLTACAELAAIACAVAWVCHPLFEIHWYDNHEIDRYPGRLEVLYRHISWAQPVPRWIPELAGGRGYPLFNFFNPMFLYVALPIRAFGVDPITACKWTVAAFLMVGGCATASLARELAPKASGFVGVLAALLFVSAPYTMSNIYIRGDLAELAATQIFPVVLLYSHRFLLAARGSTTEYASWLAVAMGFGLMVPSHAFSGMIFIHAFFLILAFLVIARRVRWARLLQLGLACLFGAGLAAFYWVPILFEMGTVSIHGFFTMELFHTYALPTVASLLTDQFDGAMGHQLFTFGWLLPPAALIGWAVVRKEPGASKVWLNGLLVTAASAAFLSTDAAAFVYANIPHLALMVFPWRWLALGSLALSVLAASGVSRLPIALHPLLIALVVVAHASGVHAASPVHIPDEDFDFVRRADEEVFLFDYGEYYPAGASRQARPVGPARIAGGEVLRAESSGPRVPASITVEVQTPADTQLVFPHHRWIGFEARVDGERVRLRHDQLGLAVVDVTAGRHTAVLQWVGTRAHVVGEWTTALSVFLWLVLAGWVCHRRWGRPA